ncbi:hypothetical protein CCHOA_05645 [Corynebacterium choanae]|uniref:Uncharacterized protein n=1 Tax=Corynebacterium choanae TaxID=1862358 RepID=A0A3G6J6G8_9CORY|nr:hypothetical protein CCHOA_05645 [Corynebacterium choanae]
MNRKQTESLGKLQLSLMFSLSLVTNLSISGAKVATGQESITVHDFSSIFGMAISLLLLVFCAIYATQRLGKGFLIKTVAFAIGFFLIAYGAHSPTGNIITALIALAVMLAYAFKVRNDFLKGRVK